jgi:hypothetical protein
MKLHYSKLTPVAFAATTAQAGYPATNLGSESILKPWYATTTGANDVTFTLAAPLFVQTLFVHDVNFASCTVEKSVDGVAWVAVGVLTTYPDRHGRRRGNITVNAAGQLALRARIASAPTTDGLAFHRIGAAYVFAAAVAVLALPQYGYRVRQKRPRVSKDLPNGQTAVATTGANRDRIDFTLDRQYTEVADDLVQRTSAGTCLVDLQLPFYPEQQWPVRCLEEDLEENFNRKTLSTLQIPLMEAT